MVPIAQGGAAADAPSSTHDRLIAAVEALVVERGSLDVPLRAIAATAGANVAAVNYHFGSKDKLVEAVVDRVLEQHGEIKLASLDEFAASGEHTLEQLLRAYFTDPPGLVDPQMGRFMTILVVAGSPAMMERSLKKHARARARLVELLERQLPQLSPKELHYRCILAVTLVCAHASGNFVAASTGRLDADPSWMSDALMQFLVGAFSTGPTV